MPVLVAAGRRVFVSAPLLQGKVQDRERTVGARNPYLWAARYVRTRWPLICICANCSLTLYVAATRELSQPSNAVSASVIAITASPPLGEAVAEFLARRDLDDDTRRSYGQTMTRLRRELGDAAVLADVNPGDMARVFAAWDDAAARTWNRHRWAVRSFIAWAASPSRAWVTADLAALLERRPETRDRTRAIARHEVDALLSRRDVPLREKTLWRLLYELAARADSVLSLDIEDLDRFLSVGADRCWRGSAAAWSPPVS